MTAELRWDDLRIFLLLARTGTLTAAAEALGVHASTTHRRLSTLEGAGYHWAPPGLSEVYRVSSVPRTLVFGGEGGPRRLEVRSADGSGFYFEEVRVEYRVGATGAQRFLRDSGLDVDRAERWVVAFARPILCEEFGRHTVQEVTDALTRDGARSRALERLTAALEHHGVELQGITTGKLAFDRAYETAINHRKVADQEAQRLTEELVQKEREREKRLVAVRAEIEMRDELMNGELDRLRVEAETVALKARSLADTWALKRRIQGEALSAELHAKATSVEDSERKAVEAFEAELAALEGRGLVAVRERLVSALAGTRFKLTPFVQDPTYQVGERVEHADLGAGGK